MFFPEPKDALPSVIVMETGRWSVSFTFPKQFAEKFMEAIQTDFPETKFYVAQPEDFSKN